MWDPDDFLSMFAVPADTGVAPYNHVTTHEPSPQMTTKSTATTRDGRERTDADESSTPLNLPDPHHTSCSATEDQQTNRTTDQDPDDIETTTACIEQQFFNELSISPADSTDVEMDLDPRAEMTNEYHIAVTDGADWMGGQRKYSEVYNNK